MAYSDVYAASIDETFQGRCLVAVREIARAITSGESVSNSVPTDLVALSGSENFAKTILRNRQTVSKEQIAILILSNTTIAANVAGSLDSDILWQTKEIWPVLVEIG
jgi:hypothetical protein